MRFKNLKFNKIINNIVMERYLSRYIEENMIWNTTFIINNVTDVEPSMDIHRENLNGDDLILHSILDFFEED